MIWPVVAVLEDQGWRSSRWPRLREPDNVYSIWEYQPAAGSFAESIRYRWIENDFSVSISGVHAYNVRWKQVSVYFSCTSFAGQYILMSSTSC